MVFTKFPKKIMVEVKVDNHIKEFAQGVGENIEKWGRIFSEYKDTGGEVGNIYQRVREGRME